MVTLKEISRVCHAGKAERYEGGTLLERSYLWHRELAGWLTFIFLNFLPFVKPNHVSVLMVLVGFSGCLCFSIGSNAAILMGSFLLYLSFLLDKVDGDIARYRKCFSGFGKFLDEIYHLFPQSYIYLALGFGLDGRTPNSTAIWLGIAGILAAMFNRIAPKLETLIVTVESDVHKNTNNSHDLKPGYRNPVSLWLGLITRFDWVVLLIAIAAALEIVTGEKLNIVFMAFALLVLANLLRLLVVLMGVGRRLA